MSSLNQVNLIGRVGQDIEIKYLPSGEALANVSLATSERWKDKQTGEQKEKTEWHRVVFFGRLAEVVGEYAAKGSLIYVQGKLETRKWQDQQGQDRYTTEIRAHEMKLLGSKNDNAGGGQGRDTNNGAPRQPQQQRAPQQQQRPAQQQADTDDIPF